MNKAVAVAGAGVVVAVAAAYLGATAWSGQKAQARYDEQIAKLQARLPFVRASDQKYAKGFFTSTATTTWRFGCAAATDADMPTATLTSTIRHAPLAGGAFAATVIDSQLRVSGASMQPVLAAFPGGVPLTVRTAIGFGGNASSTLTSPAATLPIGKDAQLAWQGMTGTLDSGADRRSVSYRLQSPGLTITDASTQATIHVGAVAVQSEGKATDDSGLLVVGTAQGTIASINVADSRTTPPLVFALTGLQFSSSTSMNGELLGGSGTFSGAGSFGDTKLDRVELQMSMKGLHAPTYLRMMQASAGEIYRCGSSDKAADLLALQGRMKDDLMAMLPYGPEMSIDKLAVQSGGLTGELSYGFGVDGVTAADAQLPPLPLLMAHLHAKAQGRLPIEWLRKLSQASAVRMQGKAPDPATVDVMLDQAQAKGYVVRDGDYVRSSADLAKGVLSINGKVVQTQAAAR